MTAHENSKRNLTLGRARAKNPRKRYSYTDLANMTFAMQQRKFTVRDLARRCKVSRSSAGRWINAMHEAGNIHIVDYPRSPRNRIMGAVYVWGHGDDVPKPEPLRAYVYVRRARRKAAQGVWVGLIEEKKI